MAKDVEIIWEDEGFGQILQSPQLASVCLSAAEDIAGKAGDGFKAHKWTSHAIGKSKYDRVAAIVTADTMRARRGEAKDKRLQKAVSACSTGI